MQVSADSDGHFVLELSNIGQVSITKESPSHKTQRIQLAVSMLESMGTLFSEVSAGARATDTACSGMPASY